MIHTEGIARTEALRLESAWHQEGTIKSPACSERSEQGRSGVSKGEAVCHDIFLRLVPGLTYHSESLALFLKDSEVWRSLWRTILNPITASRFPLSPVL